MNPFSFEQHMDGHGGGALAELPLVLHAVFLTALIAALLHLTSAAVLAARKGRRHPDELFAALNVPTAVALVLGFLTVVVICCHHQVVVHELEARSWHMALTAAASGLLLLAVTRTAVAAVRSRRLEQALRGVALPPSPRLTAVGERMGVFFPLVELEGALPSMTLGRLRPWIALPATLVASASDGELEAVLLHEAAHAHGRDNLKRLACLFSVSLLCWLPTASWMYRRWRESCELWCDDAAVDRTRRPLDLAAALLLETRLRQGEPPSSVSAAARGEGVRSRITRLLRGGPPLPRSAFGVLVLLLVAATAGAFWVLRDQEWIFSLWCLASPSLPPR